jgi:hypothetical protein
MAGNLKCRSRFQNRNPTAAESRNSRALIVDIARLEDIDGCANPEIFLRIAPNIQDLNKKAVSSLALLCYFR